MVPIKFRMNLWILPALLLAGTALFVSGCGESSAGNEKNETASNEQAVHVSVLELAPGKFSQTLRLTGNVESEDDVMIPAEEGGKVVKWIADRGDRVGAGQIIARLDSGVMKASFDAANASYKLAEVTYQKQKKVFEEQGISELQLKTFEYQRDAAKAQADLTRSRFEKTIIRSPIAGTLNDRFVDEGEMAAPGTPIAHVVSSSRLKITAGVPERYAGRIKVGDEVSFTIDAFAGEVFTGRVSFVSPAVNVNNRTIPVEIRIGSGGGKIKPEMIADLRVSLQSTDESIAIPSDYVQEVDINEHVVYVEKDGVAKKRIVKLGPSSDGSVLIEKGLQAGERLITLGFQHVADGQKIVVDEVTESTNGE